MLFITFLIAAELLRHRVQFLSGISMSSLQDVLNRPKSKMSVFEADTQRYDPPPGLVPLIRNMKQINGPKSLYLHKLLLVSVSSAIVTVAGSLPSTSHIGVQSTNTGSGSSIILPDMPWALIVALMLPIGAPVPIRLYPLGKARELSPLPFLTHTSIAGNCPH